MKTTYLIGSLSIVLAACSTVSDTSVQERQAMIHDQGPEVMPFALNATKHVFNKVPTGGVQEVYVLDESDTENIQQIQEHLQEIADAFEQGDFTMPKQLHGDTMAGVQYLESHPDLFSTEYVAQENGARIIYTSEDGNTIRALHDWFDTQLMDHGADAKAEFDPENDPCLDENTPEGHPPEMWRMHHGCE